MNAPVAAPSSDAPFPAEMLSAWFAQTHDLLALSDSAGRLHWTQPRFTDTLGLKAGDDLLGAAAGPDGATAHAAIVSAFSTGTMPEVDLALRASGGQTVWARIRVTRIGDRLLWTLQDTSAAHALAAQAQRLAELLEMAQEFGRLGIWEREIPSGKGRWDRHVFGFWGLPPTEGAPDHATAAAALHPDDRSSAYADSTRQAGHYTRHYRVMRPDGGTRWIHSQWEVKNSAAGIPERAIGIMVDDTAIHELASSRDAAAAELRLVTRLADIVIWRHDLRTDRIYYNEHGFEVLGLPHRHGGMTLDEARASTHPDDIAKLVASAADALATGRPEDVEVRHRRSDGSWRYLLVRRVIERGADGAPVGFVGVSLDVTSRVEQARRAEELARRLEVAAKAAGIGIWTTRVGTRHTEWNGQMYALFDMEDETEPPSLGKWLDRCIHPDDHARVASTTRAFQKRQLDAFELEFRTRRRDGRSRWVVLRARVDLSGADAYRAFGIAMDVTDRHETLAALRTANERAALIARHAGIGTWEADETGLPAVWDEQMWKLRGLSPQVGALSREERLALVHPDDRAGLLDAEPGRILQAPPGSYEFRVCMPDGSYRWLASRSAVLLDDRGEAVRRVGVNWDITEARDAELARQQVLLTAHESQAKSRFLSRMSHELRTPLNAVLGFTQLLQLEARQDDTQSGRLERLAHIRAAGEHLLALIDDALDLSNLQTGSLSLEREPVALDGLVAQALAAVTGLAAVHGVLLGHGEVPGIVQADPARLRQVLLTLLNNAVRHNPPGIRVHVASSLEGERVLLEVSDTGRGMSPEQLGRLFEPFSEIGGRREGAGSSGIGLAIARALIEGMGGTIAAHSEPGRGTRFALRLARAAQASSPHDEPPADEPPSSDASAGAPSAPPPARQAPQARQGQILYIEDNSVNVLLVEELVKSLAGLRIASEPTGAAGVARARTLRPDLVLVDMQLPDFDGFEVLRRLRAQPETATTRCIALSANAMPEDVERALSGGFDDYWTKPIKFSTFLAALERLFPTTSE